MAAKPNSYLLLLLAALVLCFLWAPVPSSAQQILETGNNLNTGMSLTVGSYRLTMEADCNLVLYNDNRMVWSTNTRGRGTNCRLTMRNDGNLVLYTGHGTAVWSSGTTRNSCHHVFVLQRDGDLVIYGPGVWDARTHTSSAQQILEPGNNLNTGSSLTVGFYRLTMEADCNLVLYDNNRAVWSTDTAGWGTDCRLTMQNDGNLVLYTGHGTAVWSSGTTRNSGHHVFVLQSDRNLAIYGPGVWDARTHISSAQQVLEPGNSLTTGSSLAVGFCRLTMEADCNLVLYDNNRAVWSTDTTGRGTDCRLTMQNDGNLVLYTGQGTAVWSRRTGRGKHVFVLQSDRNLAIYGSNIWSSGTHTSSVKVRSG